MLQNSHLTPNKYLFWMVLHWKTSFPIPPCVKKSITLLSVQCLFLKLFFVRDWFVQIMLICQTFHVGVYSLIHVHKLVTFSYIFCYKRRAIRTQHLSLIVKAMCYKVAVGCNERSGVNYACDSCLIVQTC